MARAEPKRTERRYGTQRGVGTRQYQPPLPTGAAPSGTAPLDPARGRQVLDDLFTGLVSGLVAGLVIALLTIYTDDRRSRREIKEAARLAVLQTISSGQNLDEIQLVGLDLRLTSLHNKSLRNANLNGADLTNVGMSGADLTAASLADAVLNGAGLSRATLVNASFFEAQLRSAALDRVHAEGVQLTGADLTNANLTGADLRGADLRRATLTGASFTAADLRGANLEAAQWGPRPPGLLQVCYDGKTRWPTGMDFSLVAKRCREADG